MMKCGGFWNLLSDSPVEEGNDGDKHSTGSGAFSRHPSTVIEHPCTDGGSRRRAALFTTAGQLDRFAREMCACVATPPPPSATFTIGEVDRDSPSASRSRRGKLSWSRSRSPSPMTRNSLGISIGHHTFNNTDLASPPFAARSRNNGDGFDGPDGQTFRVISSSPTPPTVSTRQPIIGHGARLSKNLRRGGTSPPASSGKLPPLSPGGFDEGPAASRVRYSSPPRASGGFAAAAVVPAAGCSTTPTVSATTPTRTAATPTSFSEEVIEQGLDSLRGRVATSPTATTREPVERPRAAGERLERRDWEAQKQEGEKRWRVRVLSGVTLFVLVVVLVCRGIGLGTEKTCLPLQRRGQDDGSGSCVESEWSSSSSSKRSEEGGVGAGGSLLSSAVAEMPAIASSKDELVAVLELAGMKKYRPAQLDRAWSALASGEARSSNNYINNNDDKDHDHDGNGAGDASGLYYYVRGGALAVKVAIAGGLRNPDFVLVLAVALGTVAAIFRGASWCKNVGSGCSGARSMRRDGGKIGRGGGGGGARGHGNGGGCYSRRRGWVLCRTGESLDDDGDGDGDGDGGGGGGVKGLVVGETMKVLTVAFSPKVKVLGVGSGTGLTLLRPLGDPREADGYTCARRVAMYRLDRASTAFVARCSETSWPPFMVKKKTMGLAYWVEVLTGDYQDG